MRLRSALLVTLLLALFAPSSASALIIGIADQKPDMFADQRFERLRIEHARYTVGWNALRDPAQRAAIDEWMVAAHAVGVHPMVSFGPSHTDRKDIPTPRRLRREFRHFLKRYPWVRTWAPWNEANHCGAQLCHRARLVARYYRMMVKTCRRCHILGAELLDMPNMISWVKRFLRRAKVQPKWWGVHNYVEANRFKTKSLRKLLRVVKGKIWLTETGGIVARRNKTKYTVKRIPESKRHALRVTRYLFHRVAKVSPRIRRIYLYHWNASTPQDSWDSALIGWDGKRRPAFNALQAEVERLHRRRVGRRAALRKKRAAIRRKRAAARRRR